MTWIALAKKEYIENVRNAWVITVSVVFLLLTLLTSYLVAAFAGPSDAAGAPAEFERVVATLSIMQSFGGFLPPILALILGFATLAGERESGSLGLLVSQPLSRTEIVLGKWLGLWGVLATAVLLGFGVGGLFVVLDADAGGAGWQALAVFLLVTLAWTAAWISITMLVSAFFQRRGTAIAGSIGLWFVFGSFVWSILTFMILGLSDGNNFDRFEDPPAWVAFFQMLNPNQVYDALLTAGIEGFGLSVDVAALMRESLRDLYTVGLFSLAMVAWIVLPLLGAIALFRARDI